MTKNTPLDFATVQNCIKNSGIPNIGKASIREIVKLVGNIENATGQSFIRGDMGVPGLPPDEIGVTAEIEALKRGVASIYPPVDGIPELKKEASRFAKLFINVDISPASCIPTTGSMQGSMAALMIGNRVDQKKGKTLYIDPGFPLHKQQCRNIGIPFDAFDVYHFRGPALREKLVSYFETGEYTMMLYSNPNNPTWVCFTEEELQIIGELANQYDIIVIEDLAYFAMDFRQDLGHPGIPPYQATVARYTDNYILLISSSKAFSYAGQRLGIMLISDVLFSRRYPDLTRFFPSEVFGTSVIYGAIYTLSAGVAHSVQCAVAAILKHANDGQYNFVEKTKEYGERAKVMKRIFLDNGFYIVYDRDYDKPIADGFYFTVAYPEFNGHRLIEELLYYGVSAISLDITGSEHSEGLRICVSQFSQDKYSILENRLKLFHENNRGL